MSKVKFVFQQASISHVQIRFSTGLQYQRSNSFFSSCDQDVETAGTTAATTVGNALRVHPGHHNTTLTNATRMSRLPRRGSSGKRTLKSAVQSKKSFFSVFISYPNQFVASPFVFLGHGRVRELETLQLADHSGGPGRIFLGWSRSHAFVGGVAATAAAVLLDQLIRPHQSPTTGRHGRPSVLPDQGRQRPSPSWSLLIVSQQTGAWWEN